MAIGTPAQGGCEPQLTGHAAANMRIGNNKEFLIKVISQCIPYIGYPRSLNTLKCVEAAAQKDEWRKNEEINICVPTCHKEN